MATKKIFVLAVLMMMAAAGLSTAEIPNLIGNWTGSITGYDRNMSYIDINKTGALNMTISDQRGRVFNGSFSLNFSLPQTGPVQTTEGFSGAIGLDNRTLYMAEYDKGYDIGTVLSNDSIELIYLEEGDGETAGAYICSLQRIK
jgi:hypothetical protein